MFGKDITNPAPTTLDRLTGSGLGLSIVREILNLHKAQYGVNSKLGKGSTFWFELEIF